MPSNNPAFRTLLTRRVVVGLIFIYLAGLGYVAELVIPFARVSHKISALLIILIVSETLFVAGVAIIGKPVYREIKKRLIIALQKRNHR